MTTQNDNTPTRNRKIGLPDPPQANSGAEQKVAVTEPSKMVQNMAAQEFAKKQTIASTTRNDKVGLTGGSAFGQNTATTAPTTTVTAPSTPTPMAGTAGNTVIGRFEPQQTGKAPTVDFSNMEAPDTWNPTGDKKYANPTIGPTSLPYMKDAAETTEQPQTNFDGMEAPKDWNPNSETSDVGYKGGPYDPSYYATLSEALNKQKSQPAPEFKRDEDQRDGGFFGWLKGLLPKNRPGKREGETDDEYDARITRNKKRLAILADAIRHMGNIINTSKGAPVQLYNDPSALLEQGYQQRKADRQKQDALKAENERKQQELTLKQQAAKADQDYKNLILSMKQEAAKRQAAKDAAAAERQANQDKQKQENWQKQFDAKQKQNAESNRLRQQSINKRGSGRSGKGGSGSGGKYWFEDKNGKMHYQPNKTMWEQEFYREYGYLPNETSNSTSTKTYDKNGNEVTTTTRKKGTAMTAEAAKKQNDAKTARKNIATKKAGSGKSTGKSKNGYKNTKALGL